MGVGSQRAAPRRRRSPASASDITARPTPAASPPRPTGTRTTGGSVSPRARAAARRSPGRCALAADDVPWFAEGTRIIPSRGRSRGRARLAPRYAARRTRSRRRRARTPATLTAGALSGHDHDGADPQQPRRAGDRLGVVAARMGDDAAGPLLGAELGQRVVGAADLERAGRLEALRLDERTVAERQQRRPQTTRNALQQPTSAALSRIVFGWSGTTRYTAVTWPPPRGGRRGGPVERESR